MTRAIFGVGVALVSSASAVALAQSASSEAEALFREGKALLQAGKVAEACAAFEGSEKLEHATSTLMNLGACLERNGQLASAWGAFVAAARDTRTATDASAKRLHQVALERAQKLEPRLSKLTIKITDDSRIDGLVIVRGDTVIEPTTWNRELPIDPGTYTITARAPDTLAWTTHVTIGPEADSRTVMIPRLQRVESRPAPVRDHGAVADAGARSADGAPSRRPLVIWGAAGVALLGGALAFDLWGDSSYNAAKAEMTSQARRDSLVHSANTRRYIAEGLVVGAVGCAGVAAWIYFRGTGSEAKPAAVTVVPVAGATQAGLAAVGVF